MRNKIPFLLFLLLLLFDQAAKLAVRHLFVSGSSLSLIRGFLSLTYVRNTGMSFGLLKGYNFLFIIISFSVLGILCNYYLRKKKHALQLSVICAGVAGNLIDRIFLGYVVDFIDFGFWPVFNVADSCITLGVSWLIIMMMRDKEQGSFK